MWILIFFFLRWDSSPSWVPLSDSGKKDSPMHTGFHFPISNGLSGLTWSHQVWKGDVIVLVWKWGSESLPSFPHSPVTRRGKTGKVSTGMPQPSSCWLLPTWAGRVVTGGHSQKLPDPPSVGRIAPKAHKNLEYVLREWADPPGGYKSRNLLYPNFIPEPFGWIKMTFEKHCSFHIWVVNIE